MWIMFPFLLWFLANKLVKSVKIRENLHPLSYFIYGGLYIALFKALSLTSGSFLLSMFSGMMGVAVAVSAIYLGVGAIGKFYGNDNRIEPPSNQEESPISLPIVDEWLQQEQLRGHILDIYRDVQGNPDMLYQFNQGIRTLEHRFFLECQNQMPPPALAYEYRQIVLELTGSIKQELSVFETDFKDTRLFFKELKGDLATRHLEHERI